MSEIHDEKSQHWPTIFLGLVVACIFLIAIFSYQVKSTEVAVVTTFGKISGIKEAGLHFRFPYPVQDVIRFDNRFRCFGGSVGKLEEVLTKDAKNITAGIFVTYNIVDPVKFYKTVVTIPNAEDKLNSIMRDTKNGVICTYSFDQLVNTDPQKIQLTEIENKIKQGIAEKVEPYGMKIDGVGISTIGVPEQISEKVFERMISERKVVASEYRSEGKKVADTLRYEADNKKREELADAEAKAKTVRAEGDAEAASYYATFRQNPELASFLRKIDSMKKIMGSKTTLVLDTDCAPFDILKMNSEKFKNESGRK